MSVSIRMQIRLTVWIGSRLSVQSIMRYGSARRGNSVRRLHVHKPYILYGKYILLPALRKTVDKGIDLILSMADFKIRLPLLSTSFSL